MILKDIRTLKASFEAKAKKRTKSFKTETNIDVEAEYNKDDKTIALRIRAYNINDDAPYLFDITIGCFAIVDDSELEHVEQLCKINLPAIAFPYLREHIDDLIRRGGFPPLHLPSVNFLEIAREETPQLEGEPQ